ncbi:hypothetical protein NX059_003740 [Plenodomus lindquistii]|nr:hypothetical protein NX059_003740 [Plenodomus lindquistii]
MTDEILAHISAPTTRQVDNLYQSVADAYHEFEPHNTLQDSHRTRRVQSRPSGASLKTSAGTRDNNSDLVATSAIASSKDSFGSFPSHVPSDDHVSSFVQGASQVEADSIEYGSGPTSSRLERLERLHQDWRQHTTPKTSFNRSFRFSRQAPQAEDDDGADTAFIEDTQLGLEALQSQLEMGSDRPSQEGTQSDAESEDYTGVFQVSDVDDNDPGSGAARLESSSAVAVHLGGNIDDLTLACPSPPGAADAPIGSPYKASRNAIAATPKISSNKKSRAVETYDFSYLEIDVFPAYADISVSRPRKLPSQKTPHLAALRTQYPKCFKLSEKKYNPLADDRGYWVVECGHWSVKSQLEFWSEMEELVSSGKLGWGTTLHRITDSANLLGQVRLYCWGELIEHMWLQLWKSSGGRVAGTHSKWYDAGGAAVLEAVYGEE